MTTPAQVEEALFVTLAESRSNTPESVREQVGSGGEIDSLEGVELVIAAEASFGIRVDDNELTPSVCQSIPRLVELVMSKIGVGTEEGQADGHP